MVINLYTGRGGEAPKNQVVLPAPPGEKAIHPRHYVADDGLINAANTALMLGQPLLLTGEPGTGKTRFAASLSWCLGLGERILRFDAKSHSLSKDLFYTIDTLGWFQVANAEKNSEKAEKDRKTALDFITYNGFGEAILRANNWDDIKHIVPPHFKVHSEKKRSVVLIDEIDKAPRDFPNDLLSEIENIKFRVPELRNVEVAADPNFSPIIVITSNSEKDLPEAFLRRCVYYDIPFPDRDKLIEITRSRLQESVKDEVFLQDCIDLFYEFREPRAGLRKKPATAELLGWIEAIKRTLPEFDNPFRESPDIAKVALAALVKTRDDTGRAEPVIESWIRKKQRVNAVD